MVMYTIKTLLKKGADILKEAEIRNHILDGEILLMHVLDVGREKLISNRDDEIEESYVKRYLELIEKRAKKEPLQYIVGYQAFMDLYFQVGEGVLIPRDDTELLVEKTIELLKGKEKPVIADLCTGCGAIGISLAYYIKDSLIYATDISKIALEYCEKNAIMNNVSDRITILEGDLTKPLFEKNLEGELDALVCNPPYISTKEIDDLSIGIKDYEPHIALFGGEEGIDFHIKILEDVSGLLKKDGLLIFEIGYNQGDYLKEYMENMGLFRDITVEKDLEGWNRCIYCFLKE